MDKIYINNLELKTLVGVQPEERRRKQPLIVNIILTCNLRKPGITDRLEDTIDYKIIEDKVASAIINNEFYLIERVAEFAAEICLEDPNVRSVIVSVEKAGTLNYGKSAVVEIERP